MSLIEIKNVVYGYNSKRPVLNNINLTIEEGEYIAILGHNGSGKSTLAKLMVGLLKANDGSIIINNLLMNEENVDKIREDVGIVFQNPDNQFFGITVRDDIAFGLENRCIDIVEMERRIDEYSKIVGMDKFLDRNPEELSGGQKQRVAIASVLAINPNIIILDEATSMLDPKGVKEVMETIRNLIGKKTIISITHNLKEVKFCDRVVILKNGRIILNDTPSNVFKNKDILLDANLDITESMQLMELIKDSSLNKKEVEDILWEYTFQK